MLIQRLSTLPFDRSMVERIGNRGWGNKPTGGLWTSPVDSLHSWEGWCKANNWYTGLVYKQVFELSVKNVCTINDHNDLMLIYHAFPRTIKLSESYSQNVIDFKKMCTQFDGIHLTSQGEQATNRSPYIDFYGWDVETVFLFNLNSVKLIKEELIQDFNVNLKLKHVSEG